MDSINVSPQGNNLYIPPGAPAQPAVPQPEPVVPSLVTPAETNGESLLQRLAAAENENTQLKAQLAEVSAQLTEATTQLNLPAEQAKRLHELMDTVLTVTVKRT